MFKIQLKAFGERGREELGGRGTGRREREGRDPRFLSRYRTIPWLCQEMGRQREATEVKSGLKSLYGTLVLAV